jgi:2-polyprenyl-3-methyl-5-hydroxy-6-metoxy-1,4-benzoquinol methylase
MDVKEAYDIWAFQYDTNHNKTRDLEAIAIRNELDKIKFSNCLEIGCGTGKNTEWLVSKSEKIVAVDLSNEMLSKAKGKISSETVTFIRADIKEEWTFTESKFDLIGFSLVLEHIEKLDHIFCETAKKITPNGYVYIGELHPFKQYTGTKARFEDEKGLQIVNCFNHHISDFVHSAKKYGFEVQDINEYFDNSDRNTIPRILTILLKKTEIEIN